ncbi:MAG: DUF2339 domain-containing protein [Pseudomonas sp.]|uniref:DUF2339 domain-containing protein n=1 Tax=Pseudomonas sp. TaxID=306 RepID=UPI0033954958
MQWLFMLVGLLCGGLVSQSTSGAILGFLLGLGLAQALRLETLARENARLTLQLKTFAARFDDGTEALHERLRRLEQAPVEPPVQATEPSVVAPAEVEVPAPPVRVAVPHAPLPASPELIWELPADLPFEAPRQSASADATRQEPSPWVAEAVESPAPPPRPPAQAPEPRQPSIVEHGFELAKAWLFGGNTVLRIGVVLLFLGLAFLLRYATEGMVVPLEARYAGVAASAMALLGLGWWLRLRNPNYGLMLQGAGIAVMYLTVFAAMRLHPLLDPKAALGLLVLVTLCSAILAVTQNALGLAVAAALGGFAAPILTSTGSGNHVALFSYFILLNGGIFAIAWFKAWRLLNLVGFVGTFGIGFAWGLKNYAPELLGSTEPFLLLFFLMYVAIGLLFARRKLREAAAAGEAPLERDALLRWSARQGDYVDGTVLFGPPLVGFGLQVALVRHLEFGAAFSALGLGLFYLTLATLLARRTAGRASLLVETCLALGVVFASLAIPLGLDASWTSAAWAVEGAGIYWLGLRQGRRLARAFALLLQAGAALAFLPGLRVGMDSLLQGSPLGALMLGLALSFSYWQLRQRATAPAVLSDRQGRLLPWLAVAGLGFLYLIAPLLFGAEATAISWALAGLATLWLGLRLQARVFLFCAFAVQLLGGLVFLLQLDAGQGAAGGVLDDGWRGLLTASLIGLTLIGGMLLAVRDPLVQCDRRLLRGMSVLLLLGLVFLNLAVLFVLPWQSASAVWGGSGLLIVWLSLQLQQRASFVFGLALQVLGGLAFLAASPLLLGRLSGEGLSPLAHAGFWTPAVLALAALVGAWRLQQARPADQALSAISLAQLSQLLLVWGGAWWVLAGVSEVLRFCIPERHAAALLLVAAVTAALWALVAVRSQWRGLAALCALLVPAGALVLLYAWHSRYHPAAEFGWLGWGLVFAVHLLSLRRLAPLLPAGPLSASHVLGCWLILGVLSLELRYLLYALSEQYNAWRWLGWALLPSAYLWWTVQPAGSSWTAPARGPWPLSAFPREYRLWAAAPLAGLMLAWFWLATLFSDGNADPLPYLPLLNPLELGLAISLLCLYRWLAFGLVPLGIAEPQATRLPLLLAGASLFALLSTAVLRAVHQWGGVPYRIGPLLESMQVQAGWSLVWTLIALPLMILGHRRGRRELWLLGAALIGVVVAKLFFVELGNRGGLERIVSFIGVGVLLLVVGYFAPLPPRQTQPETER